MSDYENKTTVYIMYANIGDGELLGIDKEKKHLRAAEKKIISGVAGRMAAFNAGSEAEIAHFPNGKPYLPDTPNCRISITHCGSFIAVSSGEESHGIDAERIEKPRESIIKRAFCEGERQYIEKSGENAAQAFYKVWTRKEALIKAAGLSLGEGMKTELCRDGKLADVIRMGENEWYFTSRETDEHIISVCTRNKPCQIEISKLCGDELRRITQNLLER